MPTTTPTYDKSVARGRRDRGPIRLPFVLLPLFATEIRGDAKRVASDSDSIRHASDIVRGGMDSRVRVVRHDPARRKGGKDQRTRRDDGLRGGKRRGSAVDVFTDACFGALVTGVVYFGPLMSLLIRYAISEEESTVDAFQYLFGHHNENKERFGALVPIRDVLLAPFFEEFIFRGVLLTVLLGRRPGDAAEDDGRLDRRGDLHQSAPLRSRAHQPLLRLTKSLRARESSPIRRFPVHLHHSFRCPHRYRVLPVQSRPRGRVVFTRLHERLRRS